MCGIAGIVGNRNLDLATAASAMAAALIHRGPDGSGSFTCTGAALVHRRLAIIDPVGGRQPLSNEDGSVQVVCNGEIYNYRELRAELEVLGHRFATHSDCEAIVHAYEQWGDDCVLHLRGMFALAVLDTRQRRLFLARDHLGIKPLFWQAVPGAVAFASELMALRRAGLPGWQPDLGAIDLYLRLQYIPSPHTAWRGVHRLPPGHRMVVGFDGSPSIPERYWDCPYVPRERPEAELVDELKAIIGGSVRAHLVSDVPFGALLSGGADSAGVVADMSREITGGVHTFTVGTTGQHGDERSAAHSMAMHVGAIHTDEEVTADPLALLPHMLDSHGQPFADDSAIPTWLVARLARRKVKMVLSGDGGDELFAGYGSYTGWLSWLAGSGSPSWRRAVRYGAHLMDAERFPARRPSAESWMATNHVLSVSLRRALWRCDVGPHHADLPAGFILPEGKDIPSLAMAQRLDLRTYLPDCVLAKVDAASMAHGLEVRTPLVDREVATWAMTIPSTHHLERTTTGVRGKYLWRAALKSRVPPGHLERPKLGFSAPLAVWCDKRTPSGQEIRRRLLDHKSPLRMWFNDQALERIASSGQPRERWLLVVLDLWLRREGA